MHSFLHGIKVQDLDEKTLFRSVWSFLAVRRLEKLSYAIGGCLGWYNYEFQTGLVRCVPTYQQHEQKASDIEPCLSNRRYYIENGEGGREGGDYKENSGCSRSANGS